MEVVPVVYDIDIDIDRDSFIATLVYMVYTSSNLQRNEIIKI